MVSLPSLLRVARIIIVFWLLAGAFYAANLAYTSGYQVAHQAFDPTDEVVLHLDLEHPYHTEMQAMVKGFQDGANDERIVRAKSIATQVTPAAPFRLQASNASQILSYQEPSFIKRLLLLALGATHEYLSLGMAAFMLGASWLLWQLVRNVTPATPFTLANARRLEWLGLLIIGIKLWQELSYLLLYQVVPDFQLDDASIPLSRYIQLNDTDALPGITAGIIIFVIAAIYRRGVVLHKEAELTV